MSKQISLETIQAIYAMRKDSSKFAAELTVHVFACPNGSKSHFHFKVSSPLVENQEVFAKTELNLMAKTIQTRVSLVPKNYTFRRSLFGDNACTNEGATDAVTVAFLLESGVNKALFNLCIWLGSALAEWPRDEQTRITLKSVYSALMRNKILEGSDASTIKVSVRGQNPQQNGGLLSILNVFLDKLEDASSDKIMIVAFDDENPCAPALRAVYADYATKMLYKEVIPELFPKIKERVLLMLNIQTTHLAQATQQNTTTDSSQTTVSDDEVSQPRAATATSGVVDSSLPEVAPGANGQSTGVTA